MLIPELLLPAQRKRASRPDDVLDLSPVDLLLPEVVKLVLRQARVLHRFGKLLQLPVLGLLEESNPDLPLCAGGEVLVVQGHVDTGLEGLVERANAVSCEEEDATEVSIAAREMP